MVGGSERPQQPAAVLTQAQREYLRGKDISEDAARAYRGRIRERLQASIFDYSLIMRELSLDDLDEAFTEPVELEPGVAPPIANALPDIIALLYLVNRERETVDNENTHDGWVMEDKVETGIKNALVRLGVSYESVNADITVERGDSLETLAEGELASLPREKLLPLLMAGEIDSDEFAQAIAEQQEDVREEE